MHLTVMAYLMVYSLNMLTGYSRGHALMWYHALENAFAARGEASLEYTPMSAACLPIEHCETEV